MTRQKDIEQRGLLLESRMNGIENSAFFRLTLGVELVEFVGDLAGAGRVFHAEEFDHVAGNVHAAGGVDAGRNAESNFARSQWPAADLRNFEQRLQPRIYRGAQRFETEFGEYAILPGQWHGVRDGGDGDYFHERLQERGLISVSEAALHESLRQFEGNARAAQRFAGIFATWLIRIQHRQRGRHAVLAWEVVVGDDEVHAEAMRGLGGGEGTNAGVHADDEMNACGRGAFDHVAAKVVAFFDSMGNVEVSRAAA